jgi:predicted nucleic acid-binding protein
MEFYFFDTSALVKRYYDESGTDTVDRLISSEIPTVISSLSVIETTSAFRRKYNRDEITEDEMNALLGEFFREALDDFIIVPLDESLTQFSFELVTADDLRTLDSLQLSAALSLATEEESPVFVCADTDLVSTAKQHGLDTVNPERAES